LTGPADRVTFRDTEGAFGRRAGRTRAQTHTMSKNAEADRWFRSADWDEASQAEFTAKLARARPHNRYQYRRVKALALLQTRNRAREAAGRALLEENLALANLPAHERTLALGTLARHDLVGGRLDSAMLYLRAALAIGGPDASGTTGEEEIELAEVLLANGGAEDAHEAKALLDRRASHLPLFVGAATVWLSRRSEFPYCDLTYLRRPTGLRLRLPWRLPRTRDCGTTQSSDSLKPMKPNLRGCVRWRIRQPSSDICAR
jgi:hypothetical protein